MNSKQARQFAKDKLVFTVTEDTLVAMEEANISQKEMAKILGKSKSFMTQVLSGNRDMTLKTLSDLCFALGIEPKFILTKCAQPLSKATYEKVES